MPLSACKILIVLWLCLVSSVVSAENRMVFSSIEGSPLSKIAGAVLQKAYGELGIEVDTYFTSGKRSLVLSSTGHVDGELVRVAAVGGLYPSLVQVPVPTLVLHGIVYVREGDRARVAAGDLSKLPVGHLGGVVQSTQFTKGFESLWVGQSEIELFRLLAAGKLDAVVSDSIDGQMAINELGLTDVVPLGPPFQSEPMYHFLHERHRHLVPKIAQILMTMRESGEVEAITKSVLASLSWKARQLAVK